MKVTVASTTYSVRWEHEDYMQAALMRQFWLEYCWRWGQYPLPPPATETTICVLSADGHIFATARVRRHRRDPYNKNKARRYALAKLLREQFPHMPSVRGLFWHAYREQLGHW